MPRLIPTNRNTKTTGLEIFIGLDRDEAAEDFAEVPPTEQLDLARGIHRHDVGGLPCEFGHFRRRNHFDIQDLFECHLRQPLFLRFRVVGERKRRNENEEQKRGEPRRDTRETHRDIPPHHDIGTIHR